MSFLKKLFGISNSSQEQPVPKFTQEQYDIDYELKTRGLESVLGPMYHIVGHAIIPFDIGGTVDMYYFTNHIQGTGFATMELLDPDGDGPLPNRLGTYELVAFTKHPYNSSSDTATPFNIIERRICGTFTTIGKYSFQAILNPNETCEVPAGGTYRCIIFDNYSPENKSFMIGQRKHHLLLCLEIFRSEMEYARENGSEALFTLLKQSGYYPYSDLDREAVV